MWECIECSYTRKKSPLENGYSSGCWALTHHLDSQSGDLLYGNEEDLSISAKRILDLETGERPNTFAVTLCSFEINNIIIE